ncbi:MAG: hypothetical protein AB4060_13205 [Crocosphaera sp.]
MNKTRFIAIQSEAENEVTVRDLIRLSSIVAVEAHARGLTIWTNAGKYFSYSTFNANKVIEVLEENYSIARVEL